MKSIIYKILSEKLLDQIDADDIVTNDLINRPEYDTGEMDVLFYRYKYENNIDDSLAFDDLTPYQEKDFGKWLKYDLDYKFNELKDLYERIFSKNGNKMTLYREMKVSKTWIKSLTKENSKLGIYWSYDEGATRAHWGYNNSGRSENALLVTEVRDNQINWEETFIANLHPAIGEEEKEIRLYENEKIPLVELFINDKKINLSQKIKNNIYRS